MPLLPPAGSADLAVTGPAIKGDAPSYFTPSGKFTAVGKNLTIPYVKGDIGGPLYEGPIGVLTSGSAGDPTLLSAIADVAVLVDLLRLLSISMTARPEEQILHRPVPRPAC